MVTAGVAHRRYLGKGRDGVINAGSRAATEAGDIADGDNTFAGNLYHGLFIETGNGFLIEFELLTEVNFFHVG